MPLPRFHGWTWLEAPYERVGGPGGAIPAVAGLVSAVVPPRAGGRDARCADSGRPAGPASAGPAGDRRSAPERAGDASGHGYEVAEARAAEPALDGRAGPVQRCR